MHHPEELERFEQGPGRFRPDVGERVGDLFETGATGAVFVFRDEVLEGGDGGVRGLEEPDLPHFQSAVFQPGGDGLAPGAEPVAQDALIVGGDVGHRSALVQGVRRLDLRPFRFREHGRDARDGPGGDDPLSFQDDGLFRPEQGFQHPRAPRDVGQALFGEPRAEFVQPQRFRRAAEAVMGARPEGCAHFFYSLGHNTNNFMPAGVKASCTAGVAFTSNGGSYRRPTIGYLAPAVLW